jgi:hypothetical protein
MLFRRTRTPGTGLSATPGCEQDERQGSEDLPARPSPQPNRALTPRSLRVSKPAIVALVIRRAHPSGAEHLVIKHACYGVYAYILVRALARSVSVGDLTLMLKLLLAISKPDGNRQFQTPSSDLIAFIYQYLIRVS